MSDKQYIQPSDTFESKRFGFTQVVTSPPGKLVFVSGQVGLNRDLKLVGEGDVAAQAEQALKNLGSSLEAAGASPADITMLRTYIVDYQAEQAAKDSPETQKLLQAVEKARARIAEKEQQQQPVEPEDKREMQRLNDVLEASDELQALARQRDITVARLPSGVVGLFLERTSCSAGRTIDAHEGEFAGHLLVDGHVLKGAIPGCRAAQRE